MADHAAASLGQRYPAHLTVRQQEGQATHLTCLVCDTAAHTRSREATAAFLRRHRRCALRVPPASLPSTTPHPRILSAPRPVVTLRVLYWDGDPPIVGHWMRSRGPRARIGYEIIGVLMKESRVTAVKCRRHPAANVPPNVTLHGWEWAPRNKATA